MGKITVQPRGGEGGANLVWSQFKVLLADSGRNKFVMSVSQCVLWGHASNLCLTDLYLMFSTLCLC